MDCFSTIDRHTHSRSQEAKAKTGSLVEALSFFPRNAFLFYSMRFFLLNAVTVIVAERCRQGKSKRAESLGSGGLGIENNGAEREW